MKVPEKQQETLKKIAPVAWRIFRPRIEDQAATFVVDFLNQRRNQRLGIVDPAEVIEETEMTEQPELEQLVVQAEEETSSSGWSVWPLLSSGVIGMALGIIWGLIFRRRLV